MSNMIFSALWRKGEKINASKVTKVIVRYCRLALKLKFYAIMLSRIYLDDHKGRKDNHSIHS